MKAAKVIVDTAVWIEHLKSPDGRLAELLADSRALVHPLVLGELSLGKISNRETVLAEIKRLEPAPVADSDEILAMIERFRLNSRGVGIVDCHLLASALLAKAGIYTHDLPLKQAWLRVTGN